MAEVKDFNSYTGKKVNNEKPDSGEMSYDEKIRNHRIKVYFRTFIIMAVAVVLITILYVSWRDKNYSEANITKRINVIESTGATSMNLGGQILKYSKDGVSMISTSGEAMWNQTYQMQNPIIEKCKDVAAIGDHSGHMIYVVSTSGVLGQIDTNLPIRDFCVSEQGIVAAVLDDTDVAWIYLYDVNGNALASFKTTMKDSGYPAAVSISPNGELVAVSYLYSKNGSVQTSVAFYNFGSVGQNEIDNYVSGYDYAGSVVPYIQFINASTAVAVSDDRIMFYTGTEKPTSQIENLIGDEEIRSVFFSENYVGIVM
nr:DUF5711 family protein [Butyrivibrio sp.]